MNSDLLEEMFHKRASVVFHHMEKVRLRIGVMMFNNRLITSIPGDQQLFYELSNLTDPAARIAANQAALQRARDDASLLANHPQHGNDFWAMGRYMASVHHGINNLRLSMLAFHISGGNGDHRAVNRWSGSRRRMNHQHINLNASLQRLCQGQYNDPHLLGDGRMITGFTPFVQQYLQDTHLPSVLENTLRD